MYFTWVVYNSVLYCVVYNRYQLWFTTVYFTCVVYNSVLYCMFTTRDFTVVITISVLYCGLQQVYFTKWFTRLSLYFNSVLIIADIELVNT